MNAAETIQAAIDKLERLKSDSIPGHWAHWAEAGDVEIYSHWRDPLHPSAEVVVVNAVCPRNGWMGRIYEDNYEPTAELIVMLHRTVDAQLAILRNQLGATVDWPNSDFDLTLPKAILGEDA